MATVIAKDKYFLKSLHEEIGLFDRKLAHLQKYETFANDKERDTAVAKMTTKRATLVKTAQSLVEEGVEFKPAELPRSMRPENAAEIESVPEAEEAAPVQKAAPEATAQPAYRGTHLDYRTEIMDYLRDRKKVQTVETSPGTVA